MRENALGRWRQTEQCVDQSMDANTWQQQPEDNPETDFLSEPLVETSPANTFLLALHPPALGEEFLLLEAIQLVLSYYAAARNEPTLSRSKAEARLLLRPSLPVEQQPQGRDKRSSL